MNDWNACTKFLNLMDKTFFRNLLLHKNWPYLKFLWSVFSHIWTEYGDLLSKYPYPVQIQENKDRKNSEY